MTSYDTIEVYRRRRHIKRRAKAGTRFGWRRRDAFNGGVVATDGGQGYNSSAECQRMLHKVNREPYEVVILDA